MRNLFFTAVVSLLLLSLTACYQGRPSKEPPIHLNPNMDKQEKYKAQESSMFFENGSAMRLPVEGTVARGWLREDVEYFTGINSRGDTIKTSPVPTTMAGLLRGKERFEIYCTPCHGRIGNGQGIVVKRGMLPPPSFHEQRLRDVGDGHIFDVISNGIRNMPSYRHQVPVEDRWAIISYFRALQRSQNATKEDVPSTVLNEIE
ncbi:MAG: cytochrome c [bacterium]|nr:cytochrome c [bacterium]